MENPKHNLSWQKLDGSKYKVIHTESSLGWGGQEIRIIHEAQQLQIKGFTVCIVANRDSEIAQRAKALGITVIEARIRKKRFIDLISVFRLLTKQRPDIVCSHSSTDHWLVALARLLSRKRYKIIRGRHISARIKNSLPNKWLYRFGCDYVYTTAEFITEQFRSLNLVSEARIQTVPTGIDLGYFKHGDRPSARSALGIPETAFVLGTISTLRSWKGHRYAIEAVKQSKLKNLLFLIVGTGPQEEALKQLVADSGLPNVRFYGHQDDIRIFLDALDCFIFPSYANEGVPQALLQAMAYDLPIITTHFPPLVETLVGYKKAYFSEPESEESLCEGLQYIFTRQYDDAHASNSRPPSVRDFSLEKMANVMEAIYLKVAKS